MVHNLYIKKDLNITPYHVPRLSQLIRIGIVGALVAAGRIVCDETREQLVEQSIDFYCCRQPVG